MRTYRLRSQAVNDGQNSVIDMDLEFEGARAFVIWDSIPLGGYQLQARVEIDPGLLQKVGHPNCDYLYRGELVLPRPQDN